MNKSINSKISPTMQTNSPLELLPMSSTAPYRPRIQEEYQVGPQHPEPLLQPVDAHQVPGVHAGPHPHLRLAYGGLPARHHRHRERQLQRQPLTGHRSVCLAVCQVSVCLSVCLSAWCLGMGIENRYHYGTGSRTTDTYGTESNCLFSVPFFGS